MLDVRNKIIIISTGIILKNGSWPFMYILPILYESGLTSGGLLQIYFKS
jgi:hypothetical protein